MEGLPTLKGPFKAEENHELREQTMALCIFHERSLHTTVASTKFPDSSKLSELMGTQVQTRFRFIWDYGRGNYIR